MIRLGINHKRQELGRSANAPGSGVPEPGQACLVESQESGEPPVGANALREWKLVYPKANLMSSSRQAGAGSTVIRTS
jgi:hypothetical protein